VDKFCTTGQATDDNITRCMLSACWIIKATETQSEYLTHIPFPRQHWLREVPYWNVNMYIASHVANIF